MYGLAYTSKGGYMRYGKSDSLLSLLAFCSGMLAYVFSKFRRKTKGTRTHNASVLLGYYTIADKLTALSNGQISGMPFSVIATSRSNAIIYCVQLPFSAQVHLLGIPKTEDVVQLRPTLGKSLMEPVQLEGDYQKYFSLFVEKQDTSQTQSRYVLDPKAMAFTVDFCRSHSWEIIGPELYFVQAGMLHESDPTSTFDDVANFVAQIRPSIARAVA
jgi:hypothetical protein